MRYAISIPNGGECADPHILSQFARIAEGAGWDGIFLEDYICYTNNEYYSTPGYPTHDPWVALAAIAMSTERLILGTSVTPLPRWRPWQLARVTTTLDHLSNGRLVLGVGLGDLGDKGFTHFDEVTEAKERAALLDEGLDVLTGLWSGEPFSYQGRHYTVEEVTFLPKPVQRPRIPIWVGGSAQIGPVVRRAARYDGIMPYKLPTTDTWEDFTPDDIRSLRASIQAHRAGDGPFDIVLGGQQRGDDWDRERAKIAALADAGMTWWGEWIPASDFDTMRAAIERGPLRID